jgi:hypothetical protein
MKGGMMMRMQQFGYGMGKGYGSQPPPRNPGLLGARIGQFTAADLRQVRVELDDDGFANRLDMETKNHEMLAIAVGPEKRGLQNMLKKDDAVISCFGAGRDFDLALHRCRQLEFVLPVVECCDQHWNELYDRHE